jgi:hypothetical protein
MHKRTHRQGYVADYIRRVKPVKYASIRDFMVRHRAGAPHSLDVAYTLPAYSVQRHVTFNTAYVSGAAEQLLTFQVNTKIQCNSVYKESATPEAA